MIRTFTFQLLPTPTQQAELLRLLDTTRSIYNNGLEELIEHYKVTGKHINRYAHDRMHNKDRHPDTPAVLVDTTIVRLHGAFKSFFRGIKRGQKVGFPRFKSYLRWNSLQFRDAQQHIASGYLMVPHAMGRRIKVNQHRPIEGTLKFCRVVHKPSGWYVQAVCVIEVKPLRRNSNYIGLDFGLKSLVADSKGNKIANPKHLDRAQKKLGAAQRRAAKKAKGSHRRRKAYALVAKHHERIKNQRRDALHKIARDYVNKYQVIAIEDLNVSGMGRNHTLARSIHDASWTMLRNLLAEKAESAGRELIAVPPHYTSQKCSACGAIVPKSLSVRTHSCGECGYNDCRDINAAKNILRLGLSLRGGGALVLPMKREVRKNESPPQRASI